MMFVKGIKLHIDFQVSIKFLMHRTFYRVVVTFILYQAIILPRFSFLMAFFLKIKIFLTKTQLAPMSEVKVFRFSKNESGQCRHFCDKGPFSHLVRSSI